MDGSGPAPEKLGNLMPGDNVFLEHKSIVLKLGAVIAGDRH
ncbi:MAG: hypothetical protein AAF889_03645 [Cyanobacteria bacterium P01_D01_bin.73]